MLFAVREHMERSLCLGRNDKQTQPKCEMSILYTSVDVQLAVKMGFGAQDSGLDSEIMSVSLKKFPYQFTY